MNLIDRFVPRTGFDSYEDFKDHFTITVPESFNFAYDVVDAYAQEAPNKRALVWCDDHGNTQTFTFADLKHYSEKAANVFTSLGIRKGDHVMLALKGRYEFWFCILGLHRIGAVATPATHMLTTHDLEYRIRAAEIRAVIAVDAEGLLGHIDEACKTCSDILRVRMGIGVDRPGWVDLSAALEAAPSHFQRPSPQAGPQNGDISLLYFSSGTTGHPKMVQHDFTYPLGHILTAKYWQNVVDDGLHYTVADTGWAKCVWGKIYGQWIAGSAVFVYDYERFDAHKMLEKTAEHRVTTFCAPPTVLRFVIRQDISNYDLSALTYCTTAGEPLNPEVYDRFLEQTGLRLMEGFGQTETLVTLANYPWITPKPGAMGKPSPLYNVLLLNAEGAPCDVGEEGEIVLDTHAGSPLGIFAGYFHDDARTQATWHHGYYHTGDMAWMDEDGYYWFVGRADDVIKSSGYRIGPFEVESALLEHPAVLECAITGVPDPLRGQVVKATIVLNSGFTPSQALEQELQEHVKAVTAPYKYPRIVEFAEELPKTISGKIRRVEIRDKDGAP